MLLSFVGITGIGLATLGGIRLVRRQSPALVTTLAQTPTTLSDSMVQLVATVNTTLTELDDRYQHALQRQVDALVSGTRHAQWQEIAGSKMALEISEEDKKINRRIARLGGVVVTGLLAKVYMPTLLLTIPLAFYDLIGQARWTYMGIKQSKHLEMEHLVVVFITGLWLSGYFVVGGLSFLIYSLIRKVIYQAQDRTRKELVNILGEEPNHVWVVVDNVEMEIPFQRLQVGDTLVVQAGQMIPVDGIVTRGEAAVDQHRLTGESQPVEKGMNDPVLAATVVLSGRIHVQVVKTGEATLAAKIGEVLANTLDYHFSVEERGKEISDRWVTPSLALTGLATVLRGLQGAVAVLSNMPGIDMMFLGPITLLNYLNLASRSNVLIKDGRSLELLRKVDTVVFDKTGTLTLEQPQVKTVHRCANTEETLDERTILAYAAAAEQRQGHPIAKAILDAAAEQEIALPVIEDAHYELGYGLRVWLKKSVRSEQLSVDSERSPSSVAELEEEGKTCRLLIRVGSERFMGMELVTIPPEIMAVQHACHEVGNSLVMVAIEDKLVGAIELQPTIRPEARAVIAALHERKLETAIISGDQEAPTRSLAHALEIDRYFANVLPEEKAAFVEKLQQEGKTVCFVGDGINDAIALKKSEVSISLRGATTIATDTAQIVLMDQTLTSLPTLIDLSHELERNLMISLILVTVPCFFVIGGVFFLNVGIPLAVTTYTATFAAGVANAMSPMLRRRLTD